MHAQKRTCAFRLRHALAANATGPAPASHEHYPDGVRGCGRSFNLIGPEYM